MCFIALVNIDRGKDNINSDDADHKATGCSLLYSVYLNCDLKLLLVNLIYMTMADTSVSKAL